MNSKERFKAVCNFQKPDKIPKDYLAHHQTDKKLRDYFKVSNEQELLDCLGCDFYYITGRDISQNEGFMKFYKGQKLDITQTERTCPFGIRWKRGAYDSKFSVDIPICGPLENITSASEILRHKWPEPADFDFSLLHEECEINSKRVIIGGLWTGIMGDSYRMHGFSNFLLNISLNPELIKTLVNKVTEVYLELNDAYFSELKSKVDIWFFGNDFGTQNGLMFSPQIWYEVFYENIKLLTKLAHGYGLKVMMHSCGSISEIIPFLIEAGVDIIDPIQVTAKKMEPEYLVENFGGKIVFHGGIDTQHVLPSSKPDEVIEHVNYIVDVFTKKEGYIFAPSQLLGPDIPVENIVAMYR